MKLPSPRVVEYQAHIDWLGSMLAECLSVFHDCRYEGTQIARLMVQPILTYLRKAPFREYAAKYPIALLPRHQYHAAFDQPYPMVPCRVGTPRLLMSGRLAGLVPPGTPFEQRRITPTDSIAVPDESGASAVIKQATAEAARAGNRPWSQPSFLELFATQAPVAIARFRGVLKLIEKHKPTCTIGLASPLWPNSYLAHAARRLQLPSITVQPLTLIGTSPMAYPFKYLPVVAHTFAIWGREFADWFMEHGVPDERLAIVGNPRFEALQACETDTREQVFQRLDLPIHRRYVLLATQQLPLINREILTKAAAAAVRRATEDLLLVIKLHKGENDLAEAYATWAGDVPVRVVQHGEISIYDLIHHAACVVVYYSTAGLEAALLQTPVVAAELFGEKPVYSYLDSDYIWGATNADQLAVIINKVCCDPGCRAETLVRQEQYLRYAYIGRDSAVDRFSRLIVKLSSNAGEEAGLA